ncbi:MAG: GNAT family N-acetyltransferase [Rhodobacteraceae bacterium]|nr:GNAT family N-acetyltransferase [Paracoccaceae bacterium]
MVQIRSYRATDADELHQIFRAAVLDGAAAHYSDAQRRAWAGAAGPPGPEWEARLNAHVTWVAVDATGPLGFMTMGRDGHLDLAFVRPEAAGTGVADALHDRILRSASDLGLDRLTTDASLRAQRFFTRMGWRLLRRQVVQLHGECLENAAMEKRLA